MQGLGTLTPVECAQVFAAGDLAYYKAAGCVDSAGNDKLIADKKSQLNTKTALLIGGGALGLGLLIYFVVKK